MLETLPLIIGTKGYRLLLLASANHITPKGTLVTGYTSVYSRLGRTIIRVIILIIASLLVRSRHKLTLLVQDAPDLVTRKLIKAKQSKQLVSQLKPNKPSDSSSKLSCGLSLAYSQVQTQVLGKECTAFKQL